MAALGRFHELFPETPTDAHDVIALLDEIGSPATVASTGGRYFGFVIGGSLTAVTAASWLASAWDQNMALRRSMTISAAYLHGGTQREPMNHVPEASRRARGIEIWAALKSLGRGGLRELVERTCVLAGRFAERLRAEGYEILNDVVLNQALVSFGSAEETHEVIRRVQEDGTCWCGGTMWQGKAAMRISVSSWATTERDIDQSAEAVIRIAREVGE